MAHQIDVFDQETVEWGIKRESPYVRRRKVLSEMEDIENGKQYCSSSAAERNNQMRL